MSDLEQAIARAEAAEASAKEWKDAAVILGALLGIENPVVRLTSVVETKNGTSDRN